MKKGLFILSLLFTTTVFSDNEIYIDQSGSVSDSGWCVVSVYVRTFAHLPSGRSQAEERD